MNPEFYEQALKTYGKILQRNPNHIDAMVNMGLTYAKSGKSIEAQELWTRVLKLDPGNAEARTNLGVLQKRMFTTDNND